MSVQPICPLLIGFFLVKFEFLLNPRYLSYAIYLADSVCSSVGCPSFQSWGEMFSLMLSTSLRAFVNCALGSWSRKQDPKQYFQSVSNLSFLLVILYSQVLHSGLQPILSSFGTAEREQLSIIYVWTFSFSSTTN